MAAARQGLPVRLDRAPQRGAAFALTRASRRVRTRSIGSRPRARGSSLIFDHPPPPDFGSSTAAGSSVRPNQGSLAACAHVDREHAIRIAGEAHWRDGQRLSEYSTWRGYSVGRPLVASACPPDL